VTGLDDEHEEHRSRPMDETITPARQGPPSHTRSEVGRRDSHLIVGLLLIAVLAFAIRFIGLAVGGGLDGRVALDDGTYFAGALTFVNGRLPYRDFNILHPPGLLYLLAPFAQVGSLTTEATGLVLARLAFMLLGATNTILVGLVGARVGQGTALSAAVLYAVWILPMQGERSTLLVAPQATAMLIALLALTGRGAAELTTRRVVVAGIAIGVTGAIQIWAVMPAAVILGWLVLRTRARPRVALRIATTYVVSGAATTALLLGPLLAAVGPRMIEMIIFAQASRTGAYETNPLARLRVLEGLEAGIFSHVPEVAIPGIAMAATVLVLLVARRRPAVRLWAAVAASELAFIMAMPLFIAHYRGWPAPVMALCLGAVVAYGIERLPRPRRRLGVIAYLLALLLLATPSLRPSGSRLEVDADTPDLSEARCVIADEGYLAIRTHTLVRSLRNGCRLLPNPRSISHLNNAASGGPAQKRRDQDLYQAEMLEYFTSADVVLIGQRKRDGFTDETFAAIRAELPYETRIGPIVVLRRDAP